MRRTSRQSWILIGAALLPLSAARASETLSLSEAETQALTHSPRIQAARAEAQAAAAQAESVQAGLYPRLSIEGSYRYATEVPSLTVGPTTLTFGAHDSYSIGPMLSYSLFDGGTVRASAQSVAKVAEARELDRKQVEIQLRQATRLAYFRCQQSQQELRLVTESLRLAESQERDVRNRFQAGASSRADTLSAHREVLNLKIKKQQSEADLATSFRELAALLGSDQPGETPVLDPLEKTLQAMSAYRDATANPAPAQIESLARLSESAELGAQASRGDLWPKLGLYAKSSLDYPNGPRIERIWQNTVGANLSFPLFEASRARNQAAQRTSESLAAAKRGEQLRLDLARDWEKARIQLKNLEEQRELATAGAKEATEISELIYASYKAGRSSFLDVQGANNRALEARVLLSRIESQMLSQLAVLAALAR